MRIPNYEVKKLIFLNYRKIGRFRKNQFLGLIQRFSFMSVYIKVVVESKSYPNMWSFVLLPLRLKKHRKKPHELIPQSNIKRRKAKNEKNNKKERACIAMHAHKQTEQIWSLTPGT